MQTYEKSHSNKLKHMIKQFQQMQTHENTILTNANI